MEKIVILLFIFEEQCDGAAGGRVNHQYRNNTQISDSEKLETEA